MPDPTVMSLAEQNDLHANAPVFVNHTDEHGKVVMYVIHLPQEMVWYWDGKQHPAVTVDKPAKRLRVNTANCHAEYAQATSDENVWYLVRGGPDLTPGVVPTEVIQQAVVHNTVMSGSSVIQASGGSGGSGYGLAQIMSGGGGGAGGRLRIQAGSMIANGNLYGMPVYPPGGYGIYQGTPPRQLTSNIFANAVTAATAPRLVEKKKTEDPHRRMLISQRRSALAAANGQREKMKLMRQWKAQDLIDSPEAERVWQVRVDSQVELIKRKLEASAPGQNQRAFFRQLAVLMDELGTAFNYQDESGIQPTLMVNDTSALGGTGENPTSGLRIPVSDVFKRIAHTAKSWGFLVGNPSPDEKAGAMQYSSDYREGLGRKLQEAITTMQHNALFKPRRKKGR